MSRTCVQPAKPQLLSGCKGKWCFLNLQIFSKKFFHFFRPPVARKRTTEGKRFSVSTTLPIASEHSSLSLRTFAKQSVSFRLAGANVATFSFPPNFFALFFHFFALFFLFDFLYDHGCFLLLYLTSLKTKNFALAIISDTHTYCK